MRVVAVSTVRLRVADLVSNYMKPDSLGRRVKRLPIMVLNPLTFPVTTPPLFRMLPLFTFPWLTFDLPLEELAGVWGGVGGSAMRSISVGPEGGSDDRIRFLPHPSRSIDAQEASYPRLKAHTEV